MDFCPLALVPHLHPHHTLCSGSTREMPQPTSCSQGERGRVGSCPPSPRQEHSLGFLSSTHSHQTYKNLIISAISDLLLNSIEKGNNTGRALTGKANDCVSRSFVGTQPKGCHKNLWKV